MRVPCRVDGIPPQSHKTTQATNFHASVSKWFRHSYRAPKTNERPARVSSCSDSVIAAHICDIVHAPAAAKACVRYKLFAQTTLLKLYATQHAFGLGQQIPQIALPYTAETQLRVGSVSCSDSPVSVWRNSSGVLPIGTGTTVISPGLTTSP